MTCLPYRSVPCIYAFKFIHSSSRLIHGEYAKYLLLVDLFFFNVYINKSHFDFFFQFGQKSDNIECIISNR